MKIRFLLLTASILLCFNQVNSQLLDSTIMSQFPIRNLGPAGMSGRVTSIDVNPNNKKEMIIGTASGGVWMSHSKGLTWKSVFDEQGTSSIGATRFAPSNPDIIWVGTGEGNPRNSHNSGKGIYKSLDGGQSWEFMGLEETRLIHRIIIDPGNPDIVYVGALGSAWGPNEERGIFKTTDGGKTWSKILYVDENTGCADLVMDPANPQKMIASMWEFRRKPWTFTSGGKSSGLYITYDGGENWKKIKSSDGIPSGKLGRIGLGISRSHPNIIYALIEAKKNGLYKSKDGGKSWKLVTRENIGGRPFYYADIRVDPNDPNTIYNLFSRVTRSIDGGKTFEMLLPYYGVHPDHHSFYIDPDNSDYLIDGNDGGLNISEDGGDNWKFISNLPLAQPYHVNVDSLQPYHIYGGMQDNGSWKGPSEVWRRGGILNSDWQELYFGDGFDVLPVEGDERYVYAMSQGGNMSYIDTKTGKRQFIKPVQSDSVRLRFNWNAALSKDPFNTCGLYFGSQYLHYSPDCGVTWEKLSPDLTTNDSTKQQQATSGGLTIDATAAENFTTITCIAPSPFDENTIWVGTDDGLLHLTSNGGETWTQIDYEFDSPSAEKQKELDSTNTMPWIQQIHYGVNDSSEIFLVLNNYRQNDWQPYLYHTSDGGESWENMIEANDSVYGHSWSFMQDPQQENLMFLGTDFGLYVSNDKGDSWYKWKHNFPSVPVRDMAFQKREADLVLATFGRGFWVMDDIRALREMTSADTSEFQVFQPGSAILKNYTSYQGSHFPADAHFASSNGPSRPKIFYWLPETVENDTTIDEKEFTITITDSQQDTVRRKHIKSKAGLNYYSWNMRRDGFQFHSSRLRTKKKEKDLPASITVPPGEYKMVFELGTYKDSIIYEVKKDPRVEFNRDAYDSKLKKMDEFRAIVEHADTSLQNMYRKEHLMKVHNDLALIYPEEEITDSLKVWQKPVKKEIKTIYEMFYTPKDFKGLDHFKPRLSGDIYRIYRYITGESRTTDSEAVTRAMNEVQRQYKTLDKKLDKLNNSTWLEYMEKVEPLR